MPTTLTAGDIAFTALQSDNSGGGANGDFFQFVLLKDVTVGTTIYFTDSGYRTDTSTFRTNETMVRWVAQTDLAAGTLISFTVPGGTSVANTAEWTGIVMTTGAVATNAALALAAGGDNITALVSPAFGGTDLLTGTPIAAITQSPTFAGTWTSTSGNASSALPPGLTDGVNAVSITTFDNSRYNGTTTGSASDLRTAINTDSNWTGSNTPLSPHSVSSFTVTGSVPTLSINDVSQDENTGAFIFTVTLSSPAPAGGVTFDIATADGTAQDDDPATEDNDYVARSLTGQTIAEGQTTYQFTVTVNPDNIREGNETFFVNVTNIAGANAGDTQGQGTIVDDDTPVLTIADVSLTEGNSGTKTFSFAVSLDRPAPFGGVTFDIATANDTATAGTDYVATSATAVTIPEGSTSYTFDVTVNGDTDVEPDETFLVNVSNVSGASVGDGQATGTIQNEDNPPVPTASVADVAIAEGVQGVSYLVFTVNLSFAPTGTVTIDYATSDGTATAGRDYVAVSGTVSFGPGETAKTVRVPIIGDEVPEANETFTVTLSNPSGATISDGVAIGTITNDDNASGYFPLASGNFAQDWSNTGMITANDNWSGVPYIIGYRGDDLTTQTGTNPQTIIGTSSVVNVFANQTNPNTFGSGGVAEFQPGATPETTFVTDPTIALQGSGTADAPYIVLHLDSTGRQNIVVSYRLRDLDGSADNAVQPIALQYRNDEHNVWINVPAAFVSDATSGPSTLRNDILVSAVLPAETANRPQLQVRVITTNAVGNDEWVGIDDIVVTSDPGPGAIISIGNTAVFEGDSGTTQMVFVVTRAGNSSGTSTVDYVITLFTNGVAHVASPDDLAPGHPLSGTVTFGPGETEKTVVLDIQGDLAAETDEMVQVELENAVGATLYQNFGTGTIINDDGEPALVSISDPSVVEGNSGTTLLVFTVTRTGNTGAFTIDYATSSGPEAVWATPGVDYVATSGTLSFAPGEMSKTVEVTVNGDTVGELSERVALDLSNPSSPATMLETSGLGTIVNDDLLFIHQIQGSSYYSPILAAEGKNFFNVASTTIVTVQAVVTAVDNNGTRQGFYITEESGHWDADWLTSEGIFVMTRNDSGVGTAVSGVSVGDLVTVTAQVMEYQYSTPTQSNTPRTMLVNPSSIVVDSTGNTLPVLVLDASRPIPNSIMTLVTPDFTSATGATFDATRYALSFWETVEGMLVTLPDVVVADGFVSTSGSQPFFQAYSRVHADADQINSRGGYTIAGDPPSSPPDTADPDDDTIAGGRHLHDGDVNPDIIEIDFTGFAMLAPAGLTQQLSMGDGLGNVTGIVEFDFTDRKLFVTSWDQSQFVNTQPTRETTALGSDPRSLTVATFNVENLDPGEGAARFQALAGIIANNLNAPDIVIVEEIQDNNGATNNGVTDASLTWQMLVDALNALVPGAAYQWVDQAPVNNAEGGEPGGNIRVGFLYNTVRVQLGDLPADAPIEDRRKYTDRIGDGVRDAGDLIQFSDDAIAGQINSSDWSGTRLPLLAQFTFSGNTVFVVGNHFTAKGGSGNFWQLNQDVDSGEPENSGWAKRNQQALDVYAMLDHIQSNSTGAGIISGGDYNDFYFYRPLEVVTGYVLPDGTPRVGGSRFDNLTLTLPEAERYTYTFDGRSQALDHIVVNSMLSAVATYDVVHVNTGYNSLGTGADTSQRLSDHDPALASFDFRTLSEILAGTENRDVFRMEQGGDDRVSGRGGNDTFYFGAAFTAADFVDGGSGVDSIILDGNYGAGLTFGTGTTSNIVDVETISLTPAAFTDFDGSAAGSHDYDLTMLDSNVAPGGLLKVNGFWLGAGEDFTFDGSAELDGRFILLAGLGVDNLTGGSGNDIFVFGHDGRFGATDVVNGGPGYDVVYLRGDYALDFTASGAGAITGVESIFLASAADLQYAAGGDGEFDYAIVWDDAMLADTAIVTINGSSLGAGETMAFDGSDEVGGRFRLFGGAAADSLTGGGGADRIYGGMGGDMLKGNGGGDVFLYYDVSDSQSLGPDRLNGSPIANNGAFDTILDFKPGTDLIDLSVIDANTNVAGDQAFTFVGGGSFLSVVGGSSAGQLKVYQVDPVTNLWRVSGDVNGDMISDIDIDVYVEAGQSLSPSDFIL